MPEEQAQSAAALGGMFMVLGVAFLAIFALMAVSVWKIYEKAGQPGWAALVPFYNVVVWLQLVGKPVWYLALMFVPLANLYVAFGLPFWMSRCFGKSTGFAMGLIFLPFVFYPMLALDESRYLGPNG